MKLYEVKRTILCTAVLLAGGGLLATSGAAAVQGTQAPAPAEKTAAEQFKNIQVLKTMPAAELRDAMEYMSASLGVDCSFCHENPFDSDAKANKKAAREMLLMVEEINKQHFAGEQEVSCNTCHHGNVHPATSVPIDQPASATAPPGPPPAGLPTIEKVLESYVSALGGQAALDKVTTRSAKANEVTTDGDKSTVVEISKRTDKLVNVTTIGAPANVVLTVGVGGAAPWKMQVRGDKPGAAAPLRGMQLAQIRRDAEFFKATRLKELAPNAAVVGQDKIGDRAVYVVRGTAVDGVRERFYFDAQTGLLLRRAGVYRTYLGGLPFQIDYGDYRDVGGVKEPFLVTWLTSDGGWTDTFTEILHNVPVDDARFDMPAAGK